jgi:toxin ParE1/3/4
MPRIIRTPASRTDVVQIVLRIRLVNPKAARKLLNAIYDTITLLADFPGIGPKRPELATGIRSFPVAKYTDYLIFYRPITDGIEVIRVLHGAQHLPRLFR